MTVTDHDSTAPLDLAERVIALVGDRAEAQVEATRGRHGLTRFANSFIHQHVETDTTSLALTVAVDGRVASASTTRLDDLDAFVDDTINAAELSPADPHWAGLTPPTELKDDGHYDEATAAATPAERASRVEAFVSAAPDLKAAGYVDTSTAYVAFANSDGHRATGRSTRASGDGIHQTGTSAGSGHATSVALSDIDGGAIGRLAADRARASATFVDVDPGRYEVVLTNEAVATIAIFLGFYGFGARAVLDGGSFVELGEQQFDEAITLTDDATDPRTIGHGFDGEGTPTAPLTLVDHGVSASLAHDRRTAARMDTASTGHALPGAFGAGPLPANLIVGRGSSSRDELIADVERGLLITTFNYCRILDPRTQVTTGLTRNGTFLIEYGEVVGAVGNMRFTQSFVEALAPGNVLGIGDDVRHADSEFGAGMVLAPSMRLAGFHFSGGAAG